MKKSQLIRDYRILRNGSGAGGGMCTWSFAEKNGKEYFIKEFLSPIYPTNDAPGSEKSKTIKREECNRFEKEQKAIINALKDKCSFGGNLIIAVDFFRHDTHYYKITEKIDVASLSIKEISELQLKKRVLILLTVSFSVKILHSSNIVHGDLKPDNILIKVKNDKLRKEDHTYLAKLIDFDNSYFSEHPPANEDGVVGSIEYYSPELLEYVKQGDEANPKELTIQSDIFALGLIFSKYLTNSFPLFDKTKHKYASEVALSKCTIEVEKDILPLELVILVNKMLSKSKNDRPTIGKIHEELQNIFHNPDIDSWIKPSLSESPSTPSEKKIDTPKKAGLRISNNLEIGKPGVLDSSEPEKKSKLKISDNLK